jgi:CDP-diacylglycerol---serine O-phosphatidyltransferase
MLSPPAGSEPAGAAPHAPAPMPRFRELGLADAVTLANTAFGMLSILAAVHFAATGLRLVMWGAFACLPLALVCDVMDGVVARKRRSSPFGGDLDSLSDVVSFGVAPAVVGFALGLQGGWDVAILIFFVGCGVARLARYNVVAAAMTGPKGKVTHYEGTPIPTSLLVVAVLAYLYGRVGVPGELAAWRLGPFTLHGASLLYLASGAGMVSRIRIPKP